MQYEKLDNRSKILHQRAFQTNEHDANYHAIEEVTVDGTRITVPKGDVLHQFRQDVNNGALPTISWLCAPQHFSDHPSAPMYGAWYVSEVLSILTENPAVWKKTIFILNYDENDGYFDHIPPFVAPKPGDTSTGSTSPDLDYSSEYVTKEQELAYGIAAPYATEGPVGLGYRVPLIIASPWSKGGWVNSEVCDITSTIQFMEHFLSKKFGVHVFEENISSWRRAITGDLTSVFRPFQHDQQELPNFLNRDMQIAQINQAKDKPAPNNYKKLTSEEITAVQRNEFIKAFPVQEEGTKLSNALMYELYVHEAVNKQTIGLRFESSTHRFGAKALAGVFNVYAYDYKRERSNWSFACTAGSSVDHQWDIQQFKDELYDLAVHGPNGYYRTYRGKASEIAPNITLAYDFKQEAVILHLENPSSETISLSFHDAYQKASARIIKLKASSEKTLKISLKKQQRWYDMLLTSNIGDFSRRYAGRLENGKHSVSDPLMGHKI